MLSKERKKGCVRIVMPSSKSHLVTEPTPSLEKSYTQASGIVISYLETAIMTNKGARNFGKSGSKAVMTRQSRFRSKQS